MVLPPSIAPFELIVTPANNADPAQRETAHAIYQESLGLGIDTLLDDRDERPGVKFKDADLIGVPFRVVVGKKLAQGEVELIERKTRGAADFGRGSTTVASGEAARAVLKRLGR